MADATEPDQVQPAQAEHGPAAVFDSLTERVDQLVPVADHVANAVLRDDSRYMRWAGTLFAVCAVVLLPWIVVLAVTLPSRQLSPHYALAWSGFDVMEFVALALTAGSALRRSPYLATVAPWSAALLVADAWFDVMTSPTGPDRLEAIAMALLIELPLAATCLWLAHRTHVVDERRLTLLLRGRRTRTLAAASTSAHEAG